MVAIPLKKPYPTPRQGKKSRLKRFCASDDFWDAMVWWLRHEKARHLRDVRQIEADLRKLAGRGHPVRRLPPDKWIDIL